MSESVADTVRYYERSTTLRELLDTWWADDPTARRPQRAAARAELGLPQPGLAP